MLIITISLWLCSLVYSLNTDERNPALDDRWFIYKSTFNKINADFMDSKRRTVWESNLKYIEKHNLEADLHKHSYHLGINEFGDLTNHEFTALTIPTIGLTMNISNTIKNKMKLTDSTDIPESIDWQKRGYVTSVKNQGFCASCAHMAAVGCYESAFYKKTKRLVSFSVQQMVNCVNGSHGTSVSDILTQIKHRGIQAENVVPYHARKRKCVYDTSANVENLTKWGYITYVYLDKKIDNAVVVMKKAVVHIGPIVSLLDGTQISFAFYKFGIYHAYLCSQSNYNHAVVIVGYGSNFWKIKNSWGTWWGKRGYAYILKGKNQCGMEDWSLHVEA